MYCAGQDTLANGFFTQFGVQDTQVISYDLDEISSLLKRRVGPQKYELRDRTKDFCARLQFRKLQDLMLSHGWFSPAMTITSSPDVPYYSLFFRRYGSSEYTVRGRTFITSPSCGAFLPGMEPVRVRTKENWHVFGTKFSPSSLHRELSHLLGREALQSIEFDPIVRFDRGAGLLVKRMLARLYEAAALSEFELPTSGIQIRQTELSLITLVLEGLNHNYSKFVNGPERKIAPWQVRSVEEFISQNADRPLSLGDLSVVSGASARSLQYTFMRHRGCSPMEFLRRTRFERAHGELLSGSDGATVTSTALRWGFSHLSRFSAEYRRRFNESPSDTLRRARGVSRQAANAGF